MLIHYLGDERIAVDHPHGNCKGDVKAFHRTCPSVLTNLASIKDLPSNVYKSTISKPTEGCPPAQQLTHMPRNLRQIKNIQSKERQKLRLTHDALYNVHELANDLEDFVKIITTYPDLIIICGLNKLITDNSSDRLGVSTAIII